MTMRIYKSTDASAPTLQGIVGGAYSSGWADGSLVQLLNQVLVNGYGSKTAAGWTLAYHGTSEGSFRAGGGTQSYIHVLDDASATAGAREAAVTGFLNMSAIATGTDQFPSSGQNSGKLFIRKSDTADTAQRAWICMADNKTFLLFVYTGNATAYYSGSYFGDFYSYVSGDTVNSCIVARVTSAATDTLSNETLDLDNATNAAVTGHYMCRGYSQAGTSVQFGVNGVVFPSSTTANSLGARSALPYPNPSDGKLWLARAYIIDPTTAPTVSVRGFLRGLWWPQSAGAQIPFEYSLSGSGALAGRTFKALGLPTGRSSNGRWIVETSDTWD